jgi:hypothetical protein
VESRSHQLANKDCPEDSDAPGVWVSHENPLAVDSVGSIDKSEPCPRDRFARIARRTSRVMEKDSMSLTEAPGPVSRLFKHNGMSERETHSVKNYRE